MAKTGDNGGQCVTYAGACLGKKLGVYYAYEVKDSSSFKKLSGPESKSIACWSGGPKLEGKTFGAGHVGVVESWDSSTKKMTFSDSNRKKDQKVILNADITESTMKGYFGSSFIFEGYFKFK